MEQFLKRLSYKSSVVSKKHFLKERVFRLFDTLISGYKYLQYIKMHIRENMLSFFSVYNISFLRHFPDKSNRRT